MHALSNNLQTFFTTMSRLALCPLKTSVFTQTPVFHGTVSHPFSKAFVAIAN